MSVITQFQTIGHLPSRTPLFHKTGLVYFWFLNDACDMAHMKELATEYAKAGTAAVCLHARPGLLLPYGSDAWYEMIRQTTKHCAQLGMEVWLYDEDPYPSGNAGGRILMEHPEFHGHGIEMDSADLSKCTDDLFAFAPGKLLWCGVLDEQDNVVKDLMSEVGVVRRKWSVLDPWDSRWYYPATPLYDSPRSSASEPELAVKLPESFKASADKGHKLVAFVARPCAIQNIWGGLVDMLNPAATKVFIKSTHDRYTKCVGEYFGSTITAMFTDEPKFHSQRPFTPGLFEAFEKQFHYDLKPKLIHLFTEADNDDANLIRLHFRQWCGQRFVDAWMKPNAQWCKEQGLNFVGHISPEDDPVEQSSSLSNLMPLQKHFDLAGLDLIIPAVGDHKHPMINLGVIGALSVQQQQGKPGVMSEMLGVSGIGMTAQTAGRVIKWQTMMGVSTPVIHGGFNSIEGPRLVDAPPDSGPHAPIWQDMQQIAQSVAPIQDAMRDSIHIAPVAIVWPIRSFNQLCPQWQDSPDGLRGELIDLVTRCLDQQIGIHFLDEEDLQRATIQNEQLCVGQACYEHILIPSCTVLHAESLAQLKRCHEQGVKVIAAGELPTRQQTNNSLEAVTQNDLNWCTKLTPAQAVQTLPRLLDLSQDSVDIRCTAWLNEQGLRKLVMNLRPTPFTFTDQNQMITLAADEVHIIHSQA